MSSTPSATRSLSSWPSSFSKNGTFFIPTRNPHRHQVFKLPAIALIHVLVALCLSAPIFHLLCMNFRAPPPKKLTHWVARFVMFFIIFNIFQSVARQGLPKNGQNIKTYKQISNPGHQEKLLGVCSSSFSNDFVKMLILIYPDCIFKCLGPGSPLQT